MVPFCGFDQGPACSLSGQAGEDTADKKRIHSLTTILGEHVKIEKMHIIPPDGEVMGFDGAALQGPAITCEPVLRFDQPQRRPQSEPLFDVPLSQLGIPETDDGLEVLRVELGAAFLPLHFQKARKVRGRRIQRGQIAIKQDATTRKKGPFDCHADAPNCCCEAVATVKIRESWNCRGKCHIKGYQALATGLRWKFPPR